MFYIWNVYSLRDNKALVRGISTFFQYLFQTNTHLIRASKSSLCVQLCLKLCNANIIVCQVSVSVHNRLTMLRTMLFIYLDVTTQKASNWITLSAHLVEGGNVATIPTCTHNCTPIQCTFWSTHENNEVSIGKYFPTVDLLCDLILYFITQKIKSVVLGS